MKLDEAHVGAEVAVISPGAWGNPSYHRATITRKTKTQVTTDTGQIFRAATRQPFFDDEVLVEYGSLSRRYKDRLAALDSDEIREIDLRVSIQQAEFAVDAAIRKWRSGSTPDVADGIITALVAFKAAYAEANPDTPTTPIEEEAHRP